MKIYCHISLLLLFASCASSSNRPQQKSNSDEAAISFYNYSLTDIFGEPYDMSQLKGNKVLVVNTASSCGLTPQYADLQTLYNEYGNKNFVIIGFPSNSFENQEPRNNEEILEFCEKNYGVTFPMMEKTPVIGVHQHPLFKWLTNKELNGKMDVKLDNAFYKFMINKDGTLSGYVDSKVKPSDSQIISWLKK